MTGEMKGGMMGAIKGEMDSPSLLYLKGFHLSDGRDG